jgi:hypothetical protein
MATHQLDVDNPCVMTVASVEFVQSKNPEFSDRYLFHGTDGTDLYISENSTEAQLKRLNLDTDTVVGKTIRVERVKKAGKSFTNIYLVPASAAAGGSAPASAPFAPSRAPSMTVAEAAAVYGECVDKALATLGAKCEAADIGITIEAIQSAAATLFIKVTR